MDRRTLLAAAGASLLGVAMPAATPTRLGQHDVRALAASTDTLRGLARSTGGYVPALAAVAERGEKLAALPAKDATRAACLRVTASTWTSAGWSAFDAGRSKAAWTHYDRALAVAKASGDPLLAVDVMRRAGVLAAEGGNHGEALKIFEMALIKAVEAEPGDRRRTLESSLHGCTATSYAAIGRRDLALGALSRAQDALPQDVFEAADLAWRTAESYAVMGEFDTAHEHASASLTAWPAGSQRDAIKAEITVAGLHRRTGERDAEELLAGCWQRVEGTASIRARQRLMRAEGTLPA